MQGNYAGSIITGGQTVTTPSFNSPFIYFDNMPDGSYTVSLDSEWDSYQAVAPAFTKAAGWDVDLQEGTTYVAGVAQDNLFYELGMHRIDLSRNGLNFDSKEALVSFLLESDFFTNLNMTAEEKTNSLTYLIPRLPDAPYYYLSLLEDDAVSELSSLKIEPKPEQLVRTYYVVYPSASPVRSSGELIFPAGFDASKPTVKEYGEIIVKPEMYVFWK